MYAMTYDILISFLLLLGGKYPVVVEFAPFQGVPKKTRKKKDIKAATIEKGNYYNTWYRIIHICIIQQLLTYGEFSPARS